MPAGEIHMNDIGTQFRLTYKDQDSNAIDISSATVNQIMFQRPDATTFSKNMGFLPKFTSRNLYFFYVLLSLKTI